MQIGCFPCHGKNWLVTEYDKDAIDRQIYASLINRNKHVTLMFLDLQIQTAKHDKQNVLRINPGDFAPNAEGYKYKQSPYTMNKIIKKYLSDNGYVYVEYDKYIKIHL